MDGSVKSQHLESLEESSPWLRTGIALLIKLRYGHTKDTMECYEDADVFLRMLYTDIKEMK